MELPDHWVLLKDCKTESKKIADVTGINPVGAVDGVKAAASVATNLICDLVILAGQGEEEAIQGLEHLLNDMTKLVQTRFAKKH